MRFWNFFPSFSTDPAHQKIQADQHMSYNAVNHDDKDFTNHLHDHQIVTNEDLKKRVMEEVYHVHEHNAQIVEQQQDGKFGNINGSTDSAVLTKPDFANLWPSRMPVWRLILFSLWPMALNTCFTFNHAVLLPSQVIKIIGDDKKTTALGAIGALSALSTMFIGPVSGYISDHLVTRFGKRMPLILFGSIVYSIATILRIFITKPGLNTLIVNASVLLVGDMASQISTTCYIGLFPDLFVNEQIGLLSGMNSFVTLFSTALGVSLLGFLFSMVPTIAIVSSVSGAMILSALLLMLFFKEPKWHYHSVGRWIRSLRRYKAKVVDRMNEKWERLNKDQLLHAQTPNSEAIAAARLMSNMNEQQDGDFLSDADIAVLNAPTDVTMYSTSVPVASSPPSFSQTLLGIPKRIIRFILEFFSPFKSWSFIWLFLTRCFFSLGMGVVQNFSLFFFRDKVGPIYKFFSKTNLIKDEQQAQAVFMLCVLVTGLVSSVVGGMLSDRVGRRIVIMFGSWIMGVGLVGMGLVSFNYTFLLACGLVIGLGAGSFLAADLGLANDIIDPTESAKELALFQMSQTLPMVISSPLGGLIVDLGELLNHNHVIKVDKVGYLFMLFFCAGLAIATGACIWCIRVTRFKAPEEQDMVANGTSPASEAKQVPVRHISLH